MEAIALDKKGFKLLRSNSKAIAHKTLMGFNLIEAAIVLAVVGGVIGGIWVSAAGIHRKIFINELSTTVVSVASCIQRKFPNIPYDVAVAEWTNYSRAIFFGGCFPENYRLNIHNQSSGQNGYGFIYAPFHNSKVSNLYGVFYIYPFNVSDGIARPQLRFYVKGSECAEFLFTTIKKAGKTLLHYGIDNIIYSDIETVDLATLNARCVPESPDGAVIFLTFHPK